jgi:hypothetical protein
MRQVTSHALPPQQRVVWTSRSLPTPTMPPLLGQHEPVALRRRRFTSHHIASGRKAQNRLTCLEGTNALA